MCQRSIDMHPASQATEVVRKVVRKVISKVVRRLIRKVISTCTSLRTTLLTRQLMTFDPRTSWFCREELATPPPAFRATSWARLPPTPRSQRSDRGVGGSLEAWSNFRGAGWPGWEGQKGRSVGQALREWGTGAVKTSLTVRIRVRR